jgi:excisionase family DNA binding protein
MSNDGQKYLTVQEVALILKVHENTIYRWIDNGTLKAIRIGDVWRILESSLPTVN